MKYRDDDVAVNNIQQGVKENGDGRPYTELGSYIFMINDLWFRSVLVQSPANYEGLVPSYDQRRYLQYYRRHQKEW